MILNFFVIISSVLLGSTFSKFFAKVFVYQKGINLFSSSLTQNIPAFNEKLAMDKSFDIMEFLIFVAISAIFFVIFYLIFNKRNYSPKQQIFIGLTNLIFAAFVYISTMFATYSGIYTIISTIIWYLAVSIISFFIPKVVPKWNDGKRTLFNGFFLGFFLLVLLNNLTTSVALPLATFVVTPIYFYLFAQKIKILNSPVFAILFLSFIFPFNRLVLWGILLITLIAIFVTRNRDFSKILPFFDKIYPLLILFIFLYNPIFYLNTFDSIEEGFWAGWLQRLLSGQFIYKDFAAYHPPALAWGLYFFTKIFGASLFNLRLYFHLLQILGIVIIYLALNKVTKSKIIQIGILALIVAYGSSLVRNNIEIRVGSAIVPLLFVYWHNLNKRKLFLFIAGAMACLAFFVSLETGAASIIAVAVATLLSSSKKTWFSKLVYLLQVGIRISLLNKLHSKH